MELSQEQQRQVEVYLQNKDFDFIDLNVEVLDHMISDIESFLDKKYSFEDAYRTTVLKWEKYFKETSSFYFGFQYHESKIVVKKAIKIFKPFYFLYVAAYFTSCFFKISSNKSSRRYRRFYKRFFGVICRYSFGLPFDNCYKSETI
jgi:hypothetical protein